VAYHPKLSDLYIAQERPDPVFEAWWDGWPFSPVLVSSEKAIVRAAFEAGRWQGRNERDCGRCGKALKVAAPGPVFEGCPCVDGVRT